MRGRTKKYPNDQTELKCRGCGRVATMRELKMTAIPQPDGGVLARDLECPRCGAIEWMRRLSS